MYVLIKERKHLPTELYREEEELKKEMAVQDDNNISIVFLITL